MSDVRLLINGVWREGSDARVGKTLNPATEEAIGTIAHTSAEDVRQAPEAAANSFPVWRDTAARVRAGVLKRAAELIARALRERGTRPYPGARQASSRVARGNWPRG